MFPIIKKIGDAIKKAMEYLWSLIIRLILSVQLIYLFRHEVYNARNIDEYLALPSNSRRLQEKIERLDLVSTHKEPYSADTQRSKDASNGKRHELQWSNFLRFHPLLSTKKIVPTLSLEGRQPRSSANFIGLPSRPIRPPAAVNDS